MICIRFACHLHPRPPPPPLAFFLHISPKDGGIKGEGETWRRRKEGERGREKWRKGKRDVEEGEKGSGGRGKGKRRKKGRKGKRIRRDKGNEEGETKKEEDAGAYRREMEEKEGLLSG